MNRRRGLQLLATLLLCTPLAWVLTFACAPLWGWFEARTGIEALGHSGPADWCFWMTMAVCWLCVTVSFVRRRRPPAT